MMIFLSAKPYFPDFFLFYPFIIIQYVALKKFMIHLGHKRRKAILFEISESYIYKLAECEFFLVQAFINSDLKDSFIMVRFKHNIHIFPAFVRNYHLKSVFLYKFIFLEVILNIFSLISCDLTLHRLTIMEH